MLEVDGFTLIDYIKSSIEILMNMKIEENDQKHLSKSPKKKNTSPGKDGTQKPIVKIDDRTPTSSIVDLQNKLDEIDSPISSASSSSINSVPIAHKEYEKSLRMLEAECRNHIKVEQQMKLHIECL